MGVVYEAEQANPKRSVAIKVLRAGRWTDGRIERMFRREAHVLARLKHPAIAAIFQADSDDGCSYYTMELVQGVPITQFARDRGLSAKQRLALFQQVCEAIAYAHQRGVIHRDLKPSNILVDASGRPKILDFGLAKILEPDESMPAVTSPDEVGRVQGTLPYMSPEQVRGDLNEVDIRSDVYSLGVVLYELLSGRLPYAIDRTRLTEAARTICETPPLRLSSMDRALGGDLETIVLKALEKSPDRRYSSASAFAEDIARFLANQPILARPPTFTYQIRKFVARHRATSALVVVIFLLIVGATVAMGVLYARAQSNLVRAQLAEKQAQSEADRARREAQVSNAVTDYLKKVFRVSDPSIAMGRTITARQLLDSAANRVRETLSNEPLVQASLMHTIGDVYANLGLYDDGAGLLEQALALRHRLEPDSMNEAETATNLATVNRNRGKLDAAQSAYETALRIIKNHGGQDVHVTVLLQALAEVQSDRGDFDGAEKTFRELVDTLRQSPHGLAGLPSCLNSFAGVLADKGEYAKGVPFLREALEIAAGKSPPDTLLITSLRGNLAWLLAMSGENDDAEKLIREVLAQRRAVLPAMHPQIATSLITLGAIHLNRRDPAAAEPLFREATKIREKSLSKNALQIAEARGFLGVSLTRLGRYDEAENLLLDSYETRMKEPIPPKREIAEARKRLAELYREWNQPEKAAKWSGPENQ